ncbi:hypothetical protein ACLMJK_002750 [Lecanora helva]
MRHAIADASYLAGAGLNAATDFSSLPFTYFFEGNVDTANIVAKILRRVQRAQLGHTDLIGATCEDVQNRCRDGDTTIPSYSIQERDRAPVIVFCPTALKLRRNTRPCTNAPGAITLGWVMLFELVQLYYISGPTVDVEGVASQSASDVNEGLLAGLDATLDANAYAYLGDWAWDLGFGGPPWDKEETCMQNFAKGHFDLPGTAAVAAIAAGSGEGG